MVKKKKVVKKNTAAKSRKKVAKKKVVKKIAKKKANPSKTPARRLLGMKVLSKFQKPVGLEGAMQKIGEVSHYFPKVKAAAVKLKKSGLKVGDQIYIKGHTTDFKEKVLSIQLDHSKISEGKKGQEIGLSVRSRVRTGDSVYKA